MIVKRTNKAKLLFDLESAMEAREWAIRKRQQEKSNYELFMWWNKQVNNLSDEIDKLKKELYETQ